MDRFFTRKNVGPDKEYFKYLPIPKNKNVICNFLYRSILKNFKTIKYQNAGNTVKKYKKIKIQEHI
jgi:hypothetical protein